MLKVFGITMSVLLCSILLKDKSKLFAEFVSITGILIIFFYISGRIFELVKSILKITDDLPVVSSNIKMMLKVMVIVIIAQLLSNVCKDNNETSLASMVELSSKVIVITLALPLFESLIMMIVGLVK